MMIDQFVPRFREALAEWMPFLSVPLVTFIIAEIKHHKPKWKTKYRRHWPLVAVVIGILLNALGVSIKPEEISQIAFSTDGAVPMSSPSSSMSIIKVLAVGVVAGLAGKGARDWNKDRVARNRREEIASLDRQLGNRPRAKGRRKPDA